MLEQLIVLGQIPGTQIQFNFFQVLVAAASVSLVIYAQHELRKNHAGTKQTEQN